MAIYRQGYPEFIRIVDFLSATDHEDSGKHATYIMKRCRHHGDGNAQVIPSILPTIETESTISSNLVH